VKPPVAETARTPRAIAEIISICSMVTALILSLSLSVHRSQYSGSLLGFFVLVCLLSILSPFAIPADYQMF
jgi:hypothetical protein